MWSSSIKPSTHYLIIVRQNTTIENEKYKRPGRHRVQTLPGAQDQIGPLALLSPKIFQSPFGLTF